jgi:hypothetical protein|uniref:DNA mismatch repair proteins mutS family domain-containing protein n=1 Tax=viral metagenome TaxID=1070528 RepID=A0A6C0IJT5_9ZZZZ
MNFNNFANAYFINKSTSNDTSYNFLTDYDKNDIYEEIQSFTLPINYLPTDTIYPIQSHVKDDLELISTHENSTCMYDCILNPTNVFGECTMDLWSNQITNNVPFLQDTQSIVSNWDKIEYSSPEHVEQVIPVWKMLKKDASFLDKYNYVDWEQFKSLNYSTPFLQVLSTMTILSPLISLIIPIIFMVFPFVLLKIQGIPIDFSNYIKILTQLAKHHFIGKAIVSMSNFSAENFVYFLVTFGLYGMQVYQNVTTCIKYHKNVQKINSALKVVENFAEHSIQNMDHFQDVTKTCSTYAGFNEQISLHTTRLKHMKEMLRNLPPFSSSIKDYTNNGYLLRCFYELHDNSELEETMLFAFGFEGYMNNLHGLHQNIKSKHITYATYSEDATTHIKQQYYPPLLHENVVKNTCDLSNNIIISAPNKAGKTTMLKTTTLNIIFSQQFGCGFYQSAVIHPYQYIHSYLNIPDTSQRDSLFQAESRRCKTIIDHILENKGSRHFCIFDELYSGTNPEEASQAGKAFINYLSRFSNVDFMLTTHYFKICKFFKKHNNICNYKMKVDVENTGEFNYTYKLKKGISTLKGGIRVLKDLNYPEEILREVM